MNRIKNLNVKPEDCIMACMICGKLGDICLVAHRKDNGYLTGYVVLCDEHAKDSNKRLFHLSITDQNGKELKNK